jgi:hypothetical protein
MHGIPHGLMKYPNALTPVDITRNCYLHLVERKYHTYMLAWLVTAFSKNSNSSQGFYLVREGAPPSGGLCPTTFRNSPGGGPEWTFFPADSTRNVLTFWPCTCLGGCAKEQPLLCPLLITNSRLPKSTVMHPENHAAPQIIRSLDE